MDLPVESSLDQILSQLTLIGPPVLPRKILFGGEGAGEISSYVVGWMAGGGIDVVVLDGANRFDPYVISSLARKALIPPEKLLRKIRIARAFTCYQMATLVEKKLIALLRQEEPSFHRHKPWVIISGPITTFLDEDVPEREIRPLVERVLGKIEEMTAEGVPFFLFQPLVFSHPHLPRGRLGKLTESRKTYLMRRLFHFSNLVWRIHLDEEGPKLILEKGPEQNVIFERKSLQYLSDSR
jgi:hypothetical protein